MKKRIWNLSSEELDRHQARIYERMAFLRNTKKLARYFSAYFRGAAIGQIYIEDELKALAEERKKILKHRARLS